MISILVRVIPRKNLKLPSFHCSVVQNPHEMMAEIPLLVFSLLIIYRVDQSSALNENIQRPIDEKALTLNCGFMVSNSFAHTNRKYVIESSCYCMWRLTCSTTKNRLPNKSIQSAA